MRIKVAGGSYRSINEDVEWNDIPPFALLTGENGAGKSQLLQVLAEKLQPPLNGMRRAPPDFDLEIEDFKAEPHTVLYYERFSDPPWVQPIGLNEIQSLINSITGNLQTPNYQNAFDQSFYSALRQKMTGVSNDPNARRIYIEDNLSNDYFYYDVPSIQIGVSRHYVNYWLDWFDLLQKGADELKCKEELGMPPWEALNTIFRSYSIPYQTNNPLGTPIRKLFELKFVDINTGNVVAGGDVSSGEATLMKLFMLIFGFENYNSRPSILILDEPDAHLHPAMIPTFIKALQTEFVEKLSCRVIMTTHRAETITFANQDCIFEMHKQSPRIRKSRSGNETVALLTKNIVALIGKDRPIFVEDFEDKDFYTTARDILNEEGHWNESAQPSFIEAGLGQGTKRIPGGKTVVEQLVKKLRSAGANSVKGIVDRDVANVSSEGIVVIGRYSFENYLYDPLVVACALLENGQTFFLGTEETLRAGDEHRFRSMDDSDRKKIAEIVINQLENMENFPYEKGTNIEVEYTFGGKSVIPRWLVDRRGHDLAKIFFAEWKDAATVKSLMKSFKRLRIIPVELRTAFELAVSAA